MSPAGGRLFAALIVAFLTGGTALSAQEPSAPPEAPEPADERIVTPEEVREAIQPPALAALRVFVAPYRYVLGGIEHGLIRLETEHQIERLLRWQDWLRTHHLLAAFGGQGESAGIGIGGGVSLGSRTSLQVVGRVSAAQYEELEAVFSTPPAAMRVELQASYQWRPEEPFYGLGHASLRSQRTNFALRQKWVGWHAQVTPVHRIRVGAEQKIVWLETESGRSRLFPRTETLFPTLPGLDAHTTVHSIGPYFDADLFQGEYRWGAMAHAGASYQRGLADSRLSYFRYETELEGRMPVARGRSELVAQGRAELTRPQAGSEPVPFFLQPHIGGSSTLRGFSVDRFYGRNLVLATFEYRNQIHPNIQSYVFFDEGQIFDVTSDLQWLNWHRNYGVGFRLGGKRGTGMRFEVGKGNEGVTIHITFGDRPRQPLAGPVRYGTYRR